MATIPADEKVFMVSNSTNTIYSGSAALKAMSEWYTMQDVSDTIKPYKVFTALLTQTGTGDELNKNSGLLTVGVTYKIDDNSGGLDMTNVGAPNNDMGTYFIATGTTPSSYGTGNLTYDPGAPVAEVLENTIGNIWFTYNGQGLYLINSDELFLNGKTFFTITNTTNPLDVGNVVIYMYVNSVDNINMGAAVFPSGDGIDSVMTGTPIEIRIYN
jgi:hypothetical protein